MWAACGFVTLITAARYTKEQNTYMDVLRKKIKLLLNLVDHSYEYWRVWVTAFLSVPDKQHMHSPPF